MQTSNTKIDRRGLLQTAAGLAAASTLPNWFVEECAGAQGPNTATKSLRVALVGCGGMGQVDARLASAFGTINAVCDVDDARLAEAKKNWPDAASFKDFRRVMDRPDIDAVVCGTVDHWHTLVSIAAMRSGKDVYCEKPLTLTIDEGKRLVQVAKETGRVLQTGSQQRSDAKFRLACDLVRNGRIGKVTSVEVYLPTGQRGGPFRTSPVPNGFDWDMWQGPTEPVDYMKERTHVTFRYWWDYSGGTMTDWGAHHNDIALWGLGMERSGPVSIKGKPLVEMIDGGFTAASQYSVEYTYANGVIHKCQSTTANNWMGGIVDPHGQQHGVKFIGEDGWIWASRGILQASDPEMLVEPLPTSAERMYVSDNHMGNFFECVQNRKSPICEPEIGHRSASVCHLGVLAIRLGRELKWDPKRERFVDDADANTFLARKMREPWTYDKV